MNNGDVHFVEINTFRMGFNGNRDCMTVTAHNGRAATEQEARPNAILIDKIRYANERRHHITRPNV